MNIANLDLETAIWLKCRLLVEGCQIDPDISFPENYHKKKIHLYAHSHESPGGFIPDNLFLAEEEAQVLCRIRYCKNSSLKIIKKETTYFLSDEKEGILTPVYFPEEMRYEHIHLEGSRLSSICSLLGMDLLGVTPSNYCFYFKEEKQCRFCEIFPTYKDQVEYKKAIKNAPLICTAIEQALSLDSRFRHLALTTGNIRSYDYTVEYFISIGQQLLELGLASKLQHVLCTLMPPTDFRLIENLSKVIFNKVYFPIEVYNYSHFINVCPGKAEYGYQRILDGLTCAKESFGKGNAYTNLVYGIQSLDSNLTPQSFCPKRENEQALIATHSLLAMGILPSFTLYHFGGYNKIGQIKLETRATYDFFLKWAQLVYQSQLVPKEEETMIFSAHSLPNTLMNDAYRLIKKRATP